MVKLYSINCGWFIAPGSFFIAGGDESEAVRAPVPAFLIEHPKGKVLFDAGMNQRFNDYMKHSPSAAKGYGVELEAASEISAQLRLLGIDPGAIDFVALSHLHHDHCSGLSLIPNATLLIQAEEYDFACSDPSPAYDKAYFDLGHPVKKIRGEYDVFGDGSLVLFPTPGHTPGHQSARVRLAQGDVILTADCCYTGEVLATHRLTPGSWDRALHLQSLDTLRDLQSAGALIVFGHDVNQSLVTQPEPVLVSSLSR